MAVGGLITTGSAPRLLWPGLHALWGQVYNAHPTEYTDLYDIEDSNKAYGLDVQITPFGLAPIKPQGEGVEYDSDFQGFQQQYTHIAYALGYIVTFEETRDNLYEEVSMRRVKANAFSMQQTIENVGAFLYNNAFVTTYFTTGDGRPLIDTAHLNASGGTWSNELDPASDLSESALEDAVIQIMGFQNDRGNLISIMPRSLHIARQEWFNANRIMKSVLQSGTANNDINVLKATNAFPEGIKLNHYFTLPKSWFIRTNCPEGMKMFWRDRPSFDQDNDFDTKNLKSSSYMRFSVGATDPRGVFGSNAV